MTLRTVRVPKPMEGLFERAEEVVSAYFAQRRDKPDQGTIEIFDERYVLVRGAALSVEFFGVVRDLLGPGRQEEADEFARNILFDLAHAMGKSDARNFHVKMKLNDPIEKLSAGPVHFSHAGWAFVDISEESVPGGEEDYVLIYDHPYSFESDAWIRAERRSDFPVCIMNAGYSSGWCEESFGFDLVATELLCRARGDDCCRFVMAPPSTIEGHVSRHLKSMPGAPARSAEPQIPGLFSRKRLEDELRRAHDDLEVRVKERTEELRVASELLAREVEERAAVERKLLQTSRLEALGRLSGGIAHDFNNLLTVISGCSELMLDQVQSDSDLGSLATDVARACERASRLTEQLLVFSRQQVMATEVVDLRNIVRSMSRMLGRLLGEDVELRTSLGDVPVELRCNPGQLEQAIVNLVVNARDAIEGSGTISVEVDRFRRDGEVTVRLRVTDTGSGMTGDTLAHLFDPFFTTKGPGQGTGLGLSIVYGVVQSANGHVDVDSTPGEGSCFTLTFPFAESIGSASSATEGAGVPAASSRTILLVEDERAVRDLFARSLKGAGHRVLAADSASAAMELLDQHGAEIDLLVTDVVMPGESGADLASRVHKVYPEVKVIFMSGYTHDRIGKAALKESGGVFLQKPLKLADLRKCIRELFE